MAQVQWVRWSQVERYPWLGTAGWRGSGEAPGEGSNAPTGYPWSLRTRLVPSKVFFVIVSVNLPDFGERMLARGRGYGNTCNLCNHLHASSPLWGQLSPCFHPLSQVLRFQDPIIWLQKNPPPSAWSRSPPLPITAGRTPRALAGWMTCRLMAGIVSCPPSAFWGPGPRVTSARRSWRTSRHSCSYTSTVSHGKCRPMPVSFSLNVSSLFQDNICQKALAIFQRIDGIWTLTLFLISSSALSLCCTLHHHSHSTSPISIHIALTPLKIPPCSRPRITVCSWSSAQHPGLRVSPSQPRLCPPFFRVYKVLPVPNHSPVCSSRLCPLFL